MAEIQIKINDKEYYLKGDDIQWVIGQYKEKNIKDSKTGEVTREVKFDSEYFFASLVGALQFIAEWKLRISDANTLADILNEIKILRKEIIDQYSI